MKERTLAMVLPVYDTVILPGVEFRIRVDELTAEERKRLKENGGHAILLPVKSDKERAEIEEEDLADLGVYAQIGEVEDTPMGIVVSIEDGEKARILEVQGFGGVLEAYWDPVEEKNDITEKGEQNLLDRMKGVAHDTVTHIRGGDYVMTIVNATEDIAHFTVLFCPFLDMTPEEKYELLETDSLRRRGVLVYEALLRFKGTVDMQVDLAIREDSDGRVYKKAAIRKQIGILEQQLHLMDPEEKEEEDSFRTRIEKCGMPEEVKKDVLRDLKRFEQEPPNGAEYNSLYSYLDFVTTLAWKPEKTKKVNLARAAKILDRDHYGLKKVKERILEHLAVMALKGRQGGSILLFVGPPGTGKTSMGRAIAEALGRKYVRISLGGIRDEAEIRGHRRTYIGAMPGRIMAGIQRAGVMNPVMVLDEVDKLYHSYNGDPSSALLEVLDPEQNSTFTDHYVDVPYDLSQVVFLCTANDWGSIPTPLLDRMEMIEIPGYTPVEQFEIGKRHLLPMAIEEAGLTKKDVQITDAAIRQIIAEYTMEAGVRGLKKKLLSICRKAAVKILRDEAERPVKVHGKDLEEYLGNEKIIRDKALKADTVGVATGLAWNGVGGDILYIETTGMRGTGQVHVTGQLGEVMSESAEIALSLVRSYVREMDIDFKSFDIHIHVPEGAVPKDGPSAGVTLFTAIFSLLADKPVDASLAMTGEISLQGRVMPIGGLTEKLMAAERAGIRRVLIPKENERNLADVPKEILDKLEVIPVTDLKQVIREAMHMELPTPTKPFLELSRQSAAEEKKEKEENA